MCIFVLRFIGIFTGGELKSYDACIWNCPASSIFFMGAVIIPFVFSISHFISVVVVICRRALDSEDSLPMFTQEVKTFFVCY